MPKDADLILAPKTGAGKTERIVLRGDPGREDLDAVVFRQMAERQKRHAAKTTPSAAEVTSLSGEEFYRRIADSAHDWEYWLDPEDDFVFVSPSCERLTGYTREEFLADSGLAERLVHPDDKARFELHVERAHSAEQQQKANEIEFRIIARDGSERWINHRCTTMFDPHGHYLGRRVSNVDVDRYNLAEEKLLLLNRELLAIRDCARTVLHATDELKLLRDVCRIMCNVAGYHMAWVGTVEHDEGKTVRPVAWSGVEDGYLASVHITWADTERGRGPTGTAARTGKSAVIADYASDPIGRPWRTRAYQRGYRSSAAIPMLGPGGEVCAVLTVYAAQPHSFPSGTIGLLEEVAEDLSIGIGSLRAASVKNPAKVLEPDLAAENRKAPSPGPF
jgi:PAS domain S-box-containing protein